MITFKIILLVSGIMAISDAISDDYVNNNGQFSLNGVGFFLLGVLALILYHL